MEKQYDPQKLEQQYYQDWEQAGHFQPQGNGNAYCIMIPPPNVTGSLHMGHAFQDTLMDTLIRYQRMKGSKTLWQVGTDHAGIATQMVVERNLDRENISRHDLGRDTFVEKVWEWKETSGGTITQQLRRMGASVDWSRERFTMDDELSEAVKKVFIQLYDEGLIYRGKRLVNWDPVLHTALSDLEVISEEEAGQLWNFRYPISGSNETITVATTRPETMLGDAAVAVHPEDERYQHLIGKTLDHPITGRTIPVIADDYVDPEFGTGCVKITPAHDFNDYEMGKRHNLPMINIFTLDAALNENAPESYQGLDRFDARKKVIEDLEQLGLMGEIEAYTLKAPRGDRSNAIVEPMLTDQWFVKIAPLAQPAIDVVKEGKIKFVPENWSKTYFEWMNNIQDWCISRQLWWGHRIPAWYDEEGKVYVGHDESDVRIKYELGNDVKLTQDFDVLDTWFSSALWPFSTLGWPEQTEALKTFYPTNVLVTGFDIIFFWVARMIMMGLKFTGEVPFHEVYIHGLVRDAEGQKMSKSKGNILDPLDLMDGITLDDLLQKRTANMMQPKDAEKITRQTKQQFPDGIPAYGCDALRFTFCSLASTGRDIRFDLKRIEGYRNFCNKLWNAARYVLMNTESLKFVDTEQFKSQELSVLDQWIISQAQQTLVEYEQHIATYRFDLAAKVLYQFTWHQYCDWYLELTKPVLNSEHFGDLQKQQTQVTLLKVLSMILRMAHPMIPFISEGIWHQIITKIKTDASTIMTAEFPTQSPEDIHQDSVDEIEWLKEIIMTIRNIRGEKNIAPSKAISLIITEFTETEQQKLAQHANFLKILCRLDSLEFQAECTDSSAVVSIVNTMKLHVPLAGLIDVDAEKSRIKKAIEKEKIVLERSQSKLNNENFVAKAPTAVIEKEKQSLSNCQHLITQLEQQLAALEK